MPSDPTMTDNPLGMTDADNEGYAVSANRTPQDDAGIVGALTGKTYTPEEWADRTPQDAVQEARKWVEDGNLRVTRFDLHCSRIDALIAAVRAEERKASDKEMAQMIEDATPAIRSAIRTAAIRECVAVGDAAEKIGGCQAQWVNVRAALRGLEGK